MREPTHRGSWNPTIDTNGLSFGPQCGRLGTTAMCLLTLEVYYRYAPEEAKKGEKDPIKAGRRGVGGTVSLIKSSAVSSY